jgi:threonyl-tRNA synthetase
MINITLTDGSVKSFEGEVDGFAVAGSISPGLLKSSIAMYVDDSLVDLSTVIRQDAKVRLVTDRNPEALEIIRHDTAHILAQAVKELYPECQITIGPVIDDGFYYDIANKTPFTIEDLAKIESKMDEIYRRADKITREVWNRDKAVEFFKSIGEFYKAEIIASIPSNEDISLYRQGDFIDLCRGPHAPSTGYKKAFKLLKLAGAYWRGDHRNEMLQRIYGTAWLDKKDLEAYLHRIEEAEKRDHRKLGKELDLFHLQEEAPGQIFWHDKGYTIYKIIENYIRGKIRKNNYIEVKTPLLADKSLWEKSGHCSKFQDNMFMLERDEKTWAVKPMNCPLHIQIFNQTLKSYRELPLRMAEFGCCHRNESSGSMHGLMRVVGFTQDDAHIFCEPHQVTEETIKFTNLLKEVYADFGFTEVRVKFSDRPALRAGSDEVWDQAEQALKIAVEASGMEYELNPGEGAFYGPKLEFVLRDAIGRDWQCGTLQVDYILPERLEASYVGADGARHRPVMIHRAILGSMERFIGILIEQHAGSFPLWLSPVQVAICPVTDEVNSYAESLFDLLNAKGFRVICDTSSEKVNYKVRKHSLSKTPLILVVGKKEAENNSVSLRCFGSEKLETLALEEFITKFMHEIVAPT